MSNLTLFTKMYNKGHLKQIETSLQVTFEDLDAQIQILGNPINRWVRVKVTGEDEKVAKNYITKHIGICPTSLDEISTGTELKGCIQKIEATGLIVDIGILEPKPAYIHIPLATLQTQLLGGKEANLKKITDQFALSIDLPVSIKINNHPQTTEKLIEAELSTTQIDMFEKWQDSLLDRLIILGATTDEVAETLERTWLNRDVINTEALGLLEQVITCKLGTDAAGLIPRIGRYMRSTRLIVFNPKKID